VTAGAVASAVVLIVHATIDVDPDHHDAALTACAALQDATRAEAGCHRYDISADVADRGRFYVTELWEDDDALAAHLKQPHMKDFGRALRDAGLKGSTATKYTITGESKLF
jgi:quinol monooxygenase YgiN